MSALHPTWEAELSIVLNTFLADHRIQGSVVLPGAVYIEMALAAAHEVYGSNLGVDDLVLHRAVILDDVCDPILRTTLNEDDATLEFAVFTATADGDTKWAITATAELNTLPTPPRRHEPPDGAEPVTSIGGDDFYARTQSIGFDYGDAFRSVQSVTAGEDWAVAEIAAPQRSPTKSTHFRFHPALVDGAFQTLFGAPFLGQEEGRGPYLPTRIRHCAVYGAAEEHMLVHVKVVTATSEEVECDITITDRAGKTLAVVDGFTVQSLSASSRLSPERIDKGLFEIQWCRVDESGERTAEHASGGSWLVLADESGVGRRLAEELRRRGHRVRTVDHDRSVSSPRQRGIPREPDAPNRWVSCSRALAASGDLARHRRLLASGRLRPASAEENHQLGAFTALRLVKALAEHDAVEPRLYLVTANAQPAPGTA